MGLRANGAARGLSFSRVSSQGKLIWPGLARRAKLRAAVRGSGAGGRTGARVIEHRPRLLAGPPRVGWPTRVS
jgi:hypothetical protein